MCMCERTACERLQVPSPWGQCVIPVIQACNWSRPGSVVLLAGIHGGSDWPLAPGHCFWSYSTGFKKRWKLSITRWMDAHQRECINQYAVEAVFFSPNNKSSRCILLVFWVPCSPAVASEKANRSVRLVWSDNLIITSCGLQLCVIQSVIQEKGALEHFDGSLWRINFPVSVISVVYKLLINLNTKPYIENSLCCISRFTVRASNWPY